MTLASIVVRTTNGSTLFQNLDLSFGAERTGLVGANGAGKSTLLGLIAGTVSPTEGRVRSQGRVWSLNQQISHALDCRMVDLLGVGQAWDRVSRILNGQGSDDDLAAADWSLEAHADQALARVGMSDVSIDADSASLSGGERTRVCLAAMIMAQPDIVLLDEPTNHLDRDGRAFVSNLVREWGGCMIVASHDRDLLMQMDRIVELSQLGARVYGGNYSLYRQRKDTEQEAAEAQLAHAQKSLEQASALAQANREKRERRDSAGQRVADKGDMPKLLLGLRKSAAQKSTGKQVAISQKLVDARKSELSAAQDAIECIRTADMQLGTTGLASGREVARAENVSVRIDGACLLKPVRFHWRGPVRVAITGPNGSGKSTLLKLLAGDLRPSSGELDVSVRPVVLDQNVSLLRDNETLRDAWLRLNPEGTVQQAQAALARFLFRNTSALRTVGSLSGGERLRAGLACVLGGTNPAQLLLLDEPTNHLDLASIEAVEQALSDYDGALVVVSHDQNFLEAIGITEEIDLSGP